MSFFLGAIPEHFVPLLETLVKDIDPHFDMARDHQKITWTLRQWRQPIGLKPIITTSFRSSRQIRNSAFLRPKFLMNSTKPKRSSEKLPNR